MLWALELGPHHSGKDGGEIRPAVPPSRQLPAVVGHLLPQLRGARWPWLPPHLRLSMKPREASSPGAWSKLWPSTCPYLLLCWGGGCGAQARRTGRRDRLYQAERGSTSPSLPTCSLHPPPHVCQGLGSRALHALPPHLTSPLAPLQGLPTGPLSAGHPAALDTAEKEKSLAWTCTSPLLLVQAHTPPEPQELSTASPANAGLRRHRAAPSSMCVLRTASAQTAKAPTAHCSTTHQGVPGDTFPSAGASLAPPQEADLPHWGA